MTQENNLLRNSHEHNIMEYPVVIPKPPLISKHIGLKEHVLVKHKAVSENTEKRLH